jgi:hypothetical protein
MKAAVEVRANRGIVGIVVGFWRIGSANNAGASPTHAPKSTTYYPLVFFFIAWPWLALAPAALFLALNARVRRTSVAAAGVLWLVYAGYEYGMQRRWLCSGECNIRVDLLLIYPVLLVLSIVALVAVARARKPRA